MKFIQKPRLVSNDVSGLEMWQTAAMFLVTYKVAEIENAMSFQMIHTTTSVK